MIYHIIKTNKIIVIGASLFMILSILLIAIALVFDSPVKYNIYIVLTYLFTGIVGIIYSIDLFKDLKRCKIK